jgi:hypothetical protein
MGVGTQYDPNTFVISAAGDPSVFHAAPAIVDVSVPSTTDKTTAGTIVAGAIVAYPVDDAAIVTHVPTTNDGLPNAPPHATPINGGDDPFDVGIHCDLNAPGMPLCYMYSDDNDESISDDDAIFIIFCEIENFESQEKPSFRMFSCAELFYYVKLYSCVDLVKIYML